MLSILALISCVSFSVSAKSNSDSASSFYGFSLKTAEGGMRSLADYKGKVVLVVNVASQCGNTPQYEGLQKLYSQYSSRGFVVLGFPCNQFGGQEPGSNSEIVKFCKTNYGVTFPVFAKVDVNGSSASPLFAWLKANAPGPNVGKDIAWNFGKFLVGKDGKVLKRFEPGVQPAELKSDIEKALN